MFITYRGEGLISKVLLFCTIYVGVVGLGVWMFVSMVVWVKFSHMRMDTIRVSSEHELRVQGKVPKTTHQCVE